MHDFFSLVHPGIQSLKPYIPGKSIEEVAREQGITDIIKLASNENPLGCSPHVLSAIHQLTPQQLSIYPSSIEHPLRSALAEQLNVDTSNVLLSNGSDLIFCLLLTAFGLHQDKHVLTHDLAFISYEIQSSTLNIPVIKSPLLQDYRVDIDAMIQACSEKTALIFMANPNNPTGVSIDIDDIEKLLSQIPERVLVVLDEAYYEYSQRSGIHLLKTFPNLIITRTFSKAYGLAGLRLGYAIAHPDIIDILYRLQLPFAVNQAAMIAGMAALSDTSFLKDTIRTAHRGLEQMQNAMTEMGIPCLKSDANFITIDCQRDTKSLYDELQQHGIIARPLHPYGLSTYLRVTIGTYEQNERFIKQLSNLLNR